VGSDTCMHKRVTQAALEVLTIFNLQQLIQKKRCKNQEDPSSIKKKAG